MTKMNEHGLAPFTIGFQNRGQILAFAQNCIVPEHIDGRRSIDREKWTLGRYLLARADSDSISYPLSVAHAPDDISPDFILRNANRESLGVEVTQASPPGFDQEMTRVERGIDDSLHQPGTTINEQTGLWVSRMFGAIRRKAAGLASGRWLAADAYEVLIYDDGFAFDIDIPRALLSLHINLQTFESGFRAISILTNRPNLLRCVGGRWRILPIDNRVNDSCSFPATASDI
jgi:hypothetical protein